MELYRVILNTMQEEANSHPLPYLTKVAKRYNPVDSGVVLTATRKVTKY